jgi:hypothetical protein
VLAGQPLCKLHGSSGWQQAFERVASRAFQSSKVSNTLPERRCWKELGGRELEPLGHVCWPVPPLSDSKPASIFCAATPLLYIACNSRCLGLSPARPLSCLSTLLRYSHRDLTRLRANVTALHVPPAPPRIASTTPTVAPPSPSRSDCDRRPYVQLRGLRREVLRSPRRPRRVNLYPYPPPAPYSLCLALPRQT